MASAGCPFSDEDFRHILQLERCNSAEDGWELKRNEPGCTVWRKKGGHSVHLMKGFLDFPGIPPERLMDLIYNLEVRCRYDKIFTQYEAIETFEDHRITYAVVHLAPGIWDRDIVQFNTKRSQDGEHIVLYKNAEHPSRPEQPKKYVRGETIFSGTIVRPMPDDPSSSTCTIFIQSDVKGWLPVTIVNLLAVNGPKSWQTSVSNFYRKTYKQELEAAAAPVSEET